MGFFKKLGNAFSSSSSKADRALYLYVKCDKCGEIIKVRVDLWNELSPEYDGNKDDASTYQCRKVVVGESAAITPLNCA
jgi:NAD-dependent SIR2 family protein deacetylase